MWIWEGRDEKDKEKTLITHTYLSVDPTLSFTKAHYMNFQHVL